MSRVQRPRGMIRRWYAGRKGWVRMAIGYNNNRDPQTFYIDKRKLVKYQGQRELKSDSPIVQAKHFNVLVLMLHGARYGSQSDTKSSPGRETKKTR